MASYLIRVELYGTGSDGYEKLHKRMTANQFSQSIRFPNGKWHRLPSGTYIGVPCTFPRKVPPNV
ncbi:hypothetical protein XNC3_430024 [Xenorhabdus nematophila F1]|uniref:hypothetical protein n=1 Tax=Xenorhabdus nematophila TaxID=628 RepID=UPI0003275BB0|nr:hypothetical protein [Xenorhabdus nematophila]CCW32263.1 hypothetical protein XNC3_430024 [Xenorhabdus nematophila F1]